MKSDIRDKSSILKTRLENKQQIRQNSFRDQNALRQELDEISNMSTSQGL